MIWKLRGSRPRRTAVLRPCWIFGSATSFTPARFAAWGWWIIIAKGLTPTPFKLVTIASGAVGLDIRRFAFACVIARAGRYLLLAVLLQRYGSAVQAAEEPSSGG